MTCGTPFAHTYIIQGNSKLLMVESQIDTLTPNLFFGHNLCCKYSNGSCESILDIEVLKKIQWYKEFFNPMNFDPSNYFLKIWDSIGTPISKWIGTQTPKMGVHLRVCELNPSHFFTFPRVWMWLLGCTLNPHLSMPLLWLWAQAQG